MNNKIIVLSSGGVDSTTCLAMAVNEVGAENVIAVCVHYGQKHEKELKAAKSVAEYYSVKYYEVDLTTALQYSNCSLMKSSNKEIDHRSYAEQVREKDNGKVDTYVPFRNGLMLSAAASIAMSLFDKEEVTIYIGAHADDAAGNAYADCSEAFIEAINKAIGIGTYQKVHVVAPFDECNKADVVKKGLELQVPYHLTWSCYEGKEKPCGTCGTCIDRIQAFRKNGVKDPLMEE